LILLDTSGLLAAIDSSQSHHQDALAALREARGPRLLSPFVLAELDYLLATKVGVDAELSLLDEVARGAYRLEAFAPEDFDAARGIVAKYRDAEVGLADASIVVLADRYGIQNVLTLDRRHFGVLRASGGRRFRVAP
jgi:uncharacterized protein